MAYEIEGSYRRINAPVRFGVIICLSAFAYYTINGLVNPYSYWFDELLSVAWSGHDLKHALLKTFGDVHPPLYQVLLWLWMKIFGNSEQSTRALSAVFCAFAIAALMLLRGRVPSRVLLITLLFFSCNPYLFYYAQEARSYGLVLLLSTLLMVLQLRGEQSASIVISLLLAWTHFFGTILCVIVLAQIFFFKSHARSASGLIAAALGAVAWPVAQLLWGGTADRLGGNFWIQSSSLDSLRESLSVAWPPIFEVFERALRLFRLDDALVSTGSILLTVIAVSFLWAISTDRHLQFAELKSSRVMEVVLSAGGAVALVVLISVHTPISTPRNFVILVPYGAFLLAMMCHAVFDKWSFAHIPLSVFCLAYTLAGLYLADKRLMEKQFPMQDWRRMAELGAEAASSEKLPLFHIGSGETSADIYQFYLPPGIQSLGLNRDDLSGLPERFVLMYGHTACAIIDELALELEEMAKRIENISIRQFQTCSVGANGLFIAR